MNLSDLIPLDVIPANCGRSETKKELTNILVLSIQDLVDDADEFVELSLKTLIMNGDSRGLAHRINDSNPDFLLCRFLRAVFSFVISNNPELKEKLSSALIAVDRFSDAFAQIQNDDKWKILFSDPQPNPNRLIQYHLSISTAPSYNLVAGYLQRGICTKIKILMEQEEKFDLRLAGFILWTVDIVNSMPLNCVRPSVSDYAPGELDQIIQQTIRGIKKKSLGKNGKKEFAPASLKTRWNDWCALFYGNSQAKKLRHVSRRAGKLIKALAQEVPPEDFSSLNIDHANFLSASHSIESLEQNELFPHRVQSPLTAEKSKKIPKKAFAFFDNGRAVLVRNTSPSAFGVLPPVILAMIYDCLCSLKTDWNALNWACANMFISSMLNLGRRWNWLSSICLGSKPRFMAECTQPIFDPSKNAIYFCPELYIGLPSALIPKTAPTKTEERQFQKLWRTHDEMYESIDLIDKTILPDSLSSSFESLITERNRAIQKFPLIASGLKLQ